jgi:hypothetical protein
MEAVARLTISSAFRVRTSESQREAQPRTAVSCTNIASPTELEMLLNYDVTCGY